MIKDSEKYFMFQNTLYFFSPISPVKCVRHMYIYILKREKKCDVCPTYLNMCNTCFFIKGCRFLGSDLYLTHFFNYFFFQGNKDII